MWSIIVGPRNLTAAVLSPTSVHLRWVAPCHTHQYHIYYRGTCGSYVDEGRFDTDRQEYRFHGLQEGMNYSFTVTQPGFSGGEVLSTQPVYARTFTAGMMIASHVNSVMSATILLMRFIELSPCIQILLSDVLTAISQSSQCLIRSCAFCLYRSSTAVCGHSSKLYHCKCFLE